MTRSNAMSSEVLARRSDFCNAEMIFVVRACSIRNVRVLVYVSLT